MTDQLQECGGLVLSVADALNCLVSEFCRDGYTSGCHGHHQGDEHISVMRPLERPAQVLRCFFEVVDWCCPDDRVEVIKAQRGPIGGRHGLAAEGAKCFVSRRRPATRTFLTFGVTNHFETAPLRFC